MRICTELAKGDGLVRVLAHSMIIRLHTYGILARRAEIAGAPRGAG